MIRSSRKGFTLVEIMIVVAIIGILIAIAVPGFIKARNLSRLNACQENQTKIDGAVNQYILEEKIEDLSAAGAVQDDGWKTELVGSEDYLRSEPACPAGGDYTVLTANGSVGEAVVCSITDHPYPE